MRQLKWCLQRDRLAKVFKTSGIPVGVGRWLDDEGGSLNPGKDKQSMRRKVLVESEKVRLAVCPDVKKRVGFYEQLGGK